MTRKGGFRNIKLGKNVYRQVKRRGTPPPVPRPIEPTARRVPAVGRDAPEPEARGPLKESATITREWTMRAIGRLRTPYAELDQIPRGLGTTHAAEGWLELEPEYEPGLRDIEGFSHLIVLWVFHRAEGSELVGRPPTDDLVHGVFATRSPRRPNPIALTVVELLGREGNRLRVRGVDMLDGTPVLDIKPYLSSVPSEKLRRGWLSEAEARAASRRTPPARDQAPGPRSGRTRPRSSRRSPSDRS